MVESPNDETVLNALIHGIKPDRPLMAELVKSLKLITLYQFLSKTEEYINQEEMVGALMKSQKEKGGRPSQREQQ